MDGAKSETARRAPPSSLEDAAIVTDAAVEVRGSELRCIGTWTVAHLVAIEHWVESPPATALERGLGEQGPAELTIDGSGILALDTAGAWLLRQMVVALERSGLRGSVGALRL